jgi:hypothetical protein
MWPYGWDAAAAAPLPSSPTTPLPALPPLFLAPRTVRQKKQGSSLCRQPVTFIFGRFFLLGTSVFVSEQKIISRAEAHGMCF